jgi:NADPH-dependent 2,4-dienoyl-CoA reductase/sulfur reductase-like enzyme/rhodanese-related sulfurtransferase/TusA-related sulfurtransferase
MQKVIIIGGVAGGATAAARLRRLREDYEITVLERGHYVSFANCGLPYYVGHIIKNQSQLELMTPKEFFDRFNIDVKVDYEAISIDREKKRIEVKDLINQKKYWLDYDYLILSPGAVPIIPPFKGLENVPYFTLRTIPDSVKIRKYIEEKNIKRATIVGGGYIGLEMAENLKKSGLKVRIVEMIDQVLAPLDKEMAQFVHQELILNGICLNLGDPVDSFKCDQNNCYYVISKGGKNYETDIIILAIGVKPETQLAKTSGLELGSKGHIIVDEHMRSSDPYIYAVGDAIQIKQYQTQVPTAIPLAGPANKQGRIAADNIAGRIAKYSGVLGTSVLKVFDLTVAFVGLNEKQLKETNTIYEKIYIHPNNHAGYYPGAIPITFKLIFEIPSGKILGAQAVGGPGTEKRIDIISTVIKLNGNVFDLEELELAYAPPYGSAKDPINMAGYVASNVIKGDMPIWHWNDLEKIKKNNSYILDVRTFEEFMVGSIEGAINISDLELRERINEIPKDKDIYIYCEVGFRGYLATRLLKQNGFENVYNLTGGYKLFNTARATPQELAAACGPIEEILDEMIKEKSVELEEYVEIDACGLSCPGPLNALIKGLENLPNNKKLRVLSTDPGFKSSVEAYVKLNQGVKLLELKKQEGKLIALLQKEKVSIDQIKAPVELKKKTRKELRASGAPTISDISSEELYERLDKADGPKIIIDVRSPEEYHGQLGHIQSSSLISLGELIKNPGVLNEYKNSEIVVLCHAGPRSMMAAQLLAQAGFKDVRNLSGGIISWVRKGFPVVERKNKY